MFLFLFLHDFCRKYLFAKLWPLQLLGEHSYVKVKVGTKDAMESFNGYILVCLVTNTPYLDYLWSLCKYNPYENQF